MHSTVLLPDPGGNLVRPLDPTRLPADKVGRWMFAALAWKDMTDDQRLRWREWFDWATAPGGEFWDERQGRAILRGVGLNNAKLNAAVLPKADLSGSNLIGTILSNADLRGADLNRSRLKEADLSSADLTGADLGRTHLELAGLQRARLTDANMANAHVAGTDFAGADLSGAMMHNLDLTQVDFKDARLFGTRITEPIWGIESPRATWGGRVTFPRQLPVHPIQDVHGLPPILRRQIADAQHLRDLHRKAGRLSRAAIWFWGITCSFGQSLGRWCVFSVLVLVAFALAYTFTPFQILDTQAIDPTTRATVAHPSFAQALYFTTTTFTAPGVSGLIPASAPGKVLVSVQSLVSFLLLGGVLTIFWNKLARLA